MADNPFAAPGMSEENPFAGADMTAPPPDALADVGKTAVSEAAKAPLRPLGFIGDIGQTVEGVRGWIGRKLGTDKLVEEAQKRLTPEELHSLKQPRGAPTTEDIARGVEKAAGRELFHEPETAWGRRAGGLVAGATDPLNLAWGPGGFIRRLVEGGISGVTGEVGGEVAGPVGSVIAGGGTSLATSRIAGGSARRAQAAANAATQPTEQQIRNASRQGYQAAHAANIPLSRADVSQLGADIRDDLVNSGRAFSPRSQPKTFDEVRLLEEQVQLRRPGLRRKLGAGAPVGPVPSTYQNPASSTTEVINARERLNNIARDNAGTSEEVAARRAMELIDNYLDTVSGVNVPLRQARGNYRAAERASDLNRAVDEAARDAQARGGSVAGNLRSNLNRIIDDDTLPKTPQEEAAMRAIVGGGGIPQELAKLGPNHWLWGLWAALHGNLLHGAALIAPGSIGRWMDNRNTRRAVEELRNDILRRAPSGGGPAPPLPPQWPQGTLPAAVVRANDALSQMPPDDALR